jgi:hypothetical protein
VNHEFDTPGRSHFTAVFHSLILHSQSNFVRYSPFKTTCDRLVYKVYITRRGVGQREP